MKVNDKQVTMQLILVRVLDQLEKCLWWDMCSWRICNGQYWIEDLLHEASIPGGRIDMYVVYKVWRHPAYTPVDNINTVQN